MAKNLKIVFLDRITAGPIELRERFSKYGEYIEYEDTDADQIVERISDVDVVITNRIKLRKEHFEKAPKLKLVLITATGFNHIDIESGNEKGIKIIGDMPIYVSGDSVEMWTMPELFKIDESNEPLYVAGCPADDFSPTGQLWGNPIYDWKKHKEQNYSWWVYRVQESFKIYDVLRIDHFKGFSDFWQIDRDAEDAVNGTWEEGPGIELFEKIKEQLGDLPIIAENLGFIDAKAEKLLDDSGYPGMKILQFAFPDHDSLDLPHNYTANSVAYTGTHDNDVVNGWYEKLSEDEQKLVAEYLNQRDDETITQAMIRGIHSSVSDYSIVTMQDLLDKDASSRMNVPSTVGGNWEWRMLAEDLTEEKKEFLKDLTNRYAREREDNDEI